MTAKDNKKTCCKKHRKLWRAIVSNDLMRHVTLKREKWKRWVFNRFPVYLYLNKFLTMHSIVSWIFFYTLKFDHRLYRHQIQSWLITNFRRKIIPTSDIKLTHLIPTSGRSNSWPTLGGPPAAFTFLCRKYGEVPIF